MPDGFKLVSYTGMAANIVNPLSFIFTAVFDLIIKTPFFAAFEITFSNLKTSSGTNKSKLLGYICRSNRTGLFFGVDMLKPFEATQ